MNRRVHDLKIDLTHEHGYISCIASLILKDTKPCPQLRRLRFKTQRAITFELVDPRKSGSLLRAFQVFADSGINLSHSDAMTKGSLVDYVFWLDVDEHIDNMGRELGELAKVTARPVIHGSYPRRTS